jgi:nucleoside-diphosphate-sugar epimerase
MSKYNALIVGATGIVGFNLANHLIGQAEWTVYGLARTPSVPEGAKPVRADLLNPQGLRTAFAEVHPTHVFLATWMRQPTETENINVNAAMVHNLLNVLSAVSSVEHVASSQDLNITSDHLKLTVRVESPLLRFVNSTHGSK